MDPIKSTNELIHELEGDTPFGQFAETNERAFLRTYGAETRAVCPFCGAELRSGASYCVSCMRPLQERRMIPAKKRTGKPVRQLWTALAVLAGLSVLAAVFFAAVLPALRKRSSPELPSAAEFRVLAAGASEERQEIWTREAFSLQGQEKGYSVYETMTPAAEEPLRIAFSRDGKSLLFALADVTADESEEAMKLVETTFSAVYRYFPENLEEILDEENGFSLIETPDESFDEILTVCGIHLPEDAEVLKSYLIYADRMARTPSARVYKAGSDGRLSLFVRFDSEKP